MILLILSSFVVVICDFIDICSTFIIILFFLFLCLFFSHLPEYYPLLVFNLSYILINVFKTTYLFLNTYCCRCSLQILTCSTFIIIWFYIFTSLVILLLTQELLNYMFSIFLEIMYFQKSNVF